MYLKGFHLRTPFEENGVAPRKAGRWEDPPESSVPKDPSTVTADAQSGDAPVEPAPVEPPPEPPVQMEASRSLQCIQFTWVELSWVAHIPHNYIRMLISDHGCIMILCGLHLVLCGHLAFASGVLYTCPRMLACRFMPTTLHCLACYPWGGQSYQNLGTVAAKDYLCNLRLCRGRPHLQKWYGVNCPLSHWYHLLCDLLHSKLFQVCAGAGFGALWHFKLSVEHHPCVSTRTTRTLFLRRTVARQEQWFSLKLPNKATKGHPKAAFPSLIARLPSSTGQVQLDPSEAIENTESSLNGILDRKKKTIITNHNLQIWYNSKRVCSIWIRWKHIFKIVPTKR